MKDDIGPTDQAKTPSMNLRDFRDAGYLQEVNRRFFHPLGLALSIRRDVDGEVTLHNIWDGRDDEEGFVFEELTADERLRGKRITAEFKRRLRLRKERLGFEIQPL